jgi:uncharacterized Zn finger protein
MSGQWCKRDQLLKALSAHNAAFTSAARSIVRSKLRPAFSRLKPERATTSYSRMAIRIIDPNLPFAM